MYRVQYTENGKSWRELSYKKFHATTDQAWDQARSWDEDNFLSPCYRVVNQEGKAMPRPTR